MTLLKPLENTEEINQLLGGKPARDLISVQGASCWNHGWDVIAPLSSRTSGRGSLRLRSFAIKPWRHSCACKDGDNQCLPIITSATIYFSPIPGTFSKPCCTLNDLKRLSKWSELRTERVLYTLIWEKRKKETKEYRYGTVSYNSTSFTLVLYLVFSLYVHTEHVTYIIFHTMNAT